VLSQVRLGGAQRRRQTAETAPDGAERGVHGNQCDGEPSYRTRLKDGGDTVMAHTDVFHISTLDCINPIIHAKEAIGLALAAEQHVAKGSHLPSN